MTLSLTVLGCDGSYAGPGGAGSGYLVRADGRTLWLDAGPGTLGPLQLEVALADLDAVFVTHEHPDHAADLEGLAVALRFGSPRPSLPVYGPAGVRERLSALAAESLAFEVVEDGDVLELPDQQGRGAVRLSLSRTDHGPETLAVRVDATSAALGYSADSGPDWSLEALGPGLDLALCEATWTAANEGVAQHLSARQAGCAAAAAGVGELVLTHRWPTIPPEAVRREGEAAFGRPVHLARAGAHYLIGGTRAR
jgi:ribonuclease BN (tRNA processing enzyme)